MSAVIYTQLTETVVFKYFVSLLIVGGEIVAGEKTGALLIVAAYCAAAEFRVHGDVAWR